MSSDEDPGRHRPQNRDTAESKLRRGKKHCPVCLAPLSRITGRTRLMKCCMTCSAHPSASKCCSRCQSLGSIWENKRSAACQACGLHGSKRAVISREGF